MAGMPFGIELEHAAVQNARSLGLAALSFLWSEAPQDGLHALDHEPLRERLCDIVVGTHLEAE